MKNKNENKNKETYFKNVFLMLLSGMLISSGFALFYYSNNIYLIILGFIFGPALLGILLGYLFALKSFTEMNK